MDKYELKIMTWTGLILVFFLVAVLFGISNYATDLPECIPYDESFTNPRVEDLGEDNYQVYLLAQMWSFEPNEIYLPVGAKVDFFLSTKDVVHGMHISRKNVNMMAVPGGINKVSVNFDEPGIYDIVCHEYCGSGHQHMRAEVIVNYPK